MIIELQRANHVQRMTYEEFELRIRDGEIPPDLPVRFDAVTGDKFVPVGQLELYQVLANPHSLAFRRKLVAHGMPIVTAVLVGIQLRIYLLSWAPGAEDLLQARFTNWAPGILELGEVHRLITYGMLHLNFTHLLFNLTFLAYTGYNLERALGRLNLLLLFFGSVFCGGLLSMWMAPDRPSLGASGGDFGLIAAAVVFGWKHWEDIPAPARTKFGWALVPYLGFSLISGLTAENVDNWGHMGGLVGGAVLMTFLAPEVDPGRIQFNRWVRRVATTLFALVALGVGIWGPSLVPLVDRTDGSWTIQGPSYWREGWTFTGDRGWFSPTGDASLVVTRTVHARPLSLDDATDALIRRIGAGGAPPQVVDRRPITMAGREGRILQLRFRLADQIQHTTAVVITRGVYAYRAQLQTVDTLSDRYAELTERMFDSAVLGEPAELADARARAEMHPRSWQPAVDLGDALYRVGDATGALRAYDRALARSPVRTEALVGRLRVYADYGIEGAVDAARHALILAPTDARVVVAAADALYAGGEYDEAIGALNDAWTALPGNGILRRARLQWALPETD